MKTFSVILAGINEQPFLKLTISTAWADPSLPGGSSGVRVRNRMSRCCRIGTLDDVVFDYLVFRLRGTINPSHRGYHTCAHSAHTVS